MRTNRVLIVDDEKNIRLTLSQALEALDLETDTAVNGEEALAKLRGDGLRADAPRPEDAGDGRHGGAAPRRAS